MRNLYEIPILLYETTRDWGQRSGLSERLPERAKEKEEIKKCYFLKILPLCHLPFI